jgi:hypothetical protein
MAVALKLEGLVAKRKESLYVPGERTGAWRKIKGAGRSPARSVLTGANRPAVTSLEPKPRCGRLQRVHRGVASSYDRATLRAIRFAATPAPSSALTRSRRRQEFAGLDKQFDMLS